MNLNRIITIASNVFWEVMRERVLYLISFFILALCGARALLTRVALETQDKITVDLGIAALAILSLLVTIFASTGLINKEIEKRTILFLLAKPVSRGEVIVGKHLGISAALAILIACLTAVYFGILTALQINYPLASLLVAIIYIFLELSLIAAFAILFGVFTSSLLATLLTFAVYIMGHLSRDLLQLGEISKNITVKNITQGMYLVLPDLAKLDLKNIAVYGIIPPATELLFNAVYAITYIVLLLAIANLIFWRRQF
ncbi:MAG: ABC transporter permease [Oscillatoriaceae bacterium SKW80]|nr:ABC transporter permease [Oscillatoriaceae bacterium SKYG93]MCX8121151.1 ABC transporter permease [Oscillatoriaceae bacterium SKW80]MDW8453519.1 ABC transporter permease subunit [Oscillatoriaceae cyanobacterium SKYGB_i_bin93]HIK26869.1 ABC transporter permease subunit [Oscillatoriaceae cyanobacterium M7585_C2015_266]